MPSTRCLVPMLALALAGAASAQDAQAPPKQSPELERAIAKAKVHNKRVLAVLAPADQDFAAMLKKDRKLSRPLLYEFETVQLTGEVADAKAVEWKIPDALQYKPALVVLDAAGKVLAQMPQREVLLEGKLATGEVLGKLEKVVCAPADAEVKLTLALAEGKKTGRAVFVRFDAPW